MKKILSVALAMSLSPAHAQTTPRLTDGTLTVKEAQDFREQKIQGIQANLSYRSGAVAGIEDARKIWGYNDDNPISSSFFFKEFLNSVSDTMLTEIKYGTPIVIDPTMTKSQLEQKLRLEETQFCINQINKNGYTESKESEMNEMLTSIMHRLVNKAKKAEEQEGNEQVETPRVLTEEQKRVIEIIKAHIQSGPLNEKGQSILDIFGTVHDYDLFLDNLRRITFSKGQDTSITAEALDNGDKIELSLSMLISMRTRSDETFVRLHQCLVTYLTEQQRIFGKRYEDVKAYRVGNSRLVFRNNGVYGKKQNQIDLSQLPDNPEKRQALVLKYFFEGHEGFPNFDKEKEFLSSRLAKIHIVLPYLLERLRGAIKAHSLMAQLSKEQMDFLIDMFLEIGDQELPIDGAVSVLRQWAMENSERKDLMEAFVYYRQLDRDLNALQSYLVEEKQMQEAAKEDLEALKQLAP